MNDTADKVYDRLLLLRCQTGDADALTELIARYSPGVKLFLAKTASADIADDLLQETWIDVYRKIGKLERPEAFTAWLYRIARDKAFQHRRRRRPTSAFVDHAVEEIPADEADPFTAEDAGRVRVALDTLPVEHREVLLLRFVESMSYEQIAEVVGRPVGTIRSRLYYAKLSLREKLETKVH